MGYIDTTFFSERQDIVLNTTDFPINSLVESWIESATDEINQDVGRNFEQAAYIHTLTSFQTGKYKELIFLPNAPISLVTVTADANRNDFDENQQAVTSVIMDSEVGMIKVKPGVQSQKVVINYTGGFAIIPLKVQELCYLITQRFKVDTELKQSSGDNTTTSISSIKVVQKSSSSLTEDLKRLDAQIAKGKAELGSSAFAGLY